MPKVIGLTGGIASGKSTVANMIRNLKMPLIDSDQIAKEIMLKDSVREEIRDAFGPDVFDEKGKLSRKRLAKIIYNDDEKRNILNQLVHPLVKEEILRQLNENYLVDEIVFVDVPLLYESGFNEFMDKIIVVYVPKEVQLERLMKRDSIKELYARQKIAAQEDLELKTKKADYVIDNQRSVEYTNKQLHQVLDQIGV